MTGRRATTILAWSLWGLFVVAYGLFVWLAAWTSAPGYGGGIGEGIALSLGFGAFATVGAVVAWKVPRNSIGWLFLAIGDLLALGALGDVYAYYALEVVPDAAPLGAFAAWVAFWYWFPLLGLTLVFPQLLFPTGAPPSRRWRPVAWVAALGAAAITGMQMVADRIETFTVSLENPIGIEGLADVESSAAGSVGFAVLIACAFAAVASLVVRFRRSRGDERQQLKWYTYAAVVFICLMFAGDLLPALDAVTGSDVVFGLAVASLPTTAGIAILKYRLYEIDRIINRTLVYGALTLLLGLAYVAIVGGISALIGRAGSDVTIAGATLAIAALFQPLRRRVQTFIDRRFYRSRYDAARTVEAFAARLRSQVELESLSDELLAVVNKTLQPVHASLWLRPPEEARR